jgi:hypothetical protein
VGVSAREPLVIEAKEVRYDGLIRHRMFEALRQRDLCKRFHWHGRSLPTAVVEMGMGMETV